MKIDAETILLAIDTYLKANLNAKIVELNNEKNDSIVLSQIDSNAFFLQGLNETIANYNPYIHILLDDFSSVGIGPSTLKSLNFFVGLLLADAASDLHIGRRMLRYGRALEEVFEEGFSQILPFASFKVNSLVPISVTTPDSNDPYRAVGVEVMVELG